MLEIGFRRKIIRRMNLDRPSFPQQLLSPGKCSHGYLLVVPGMNGGVWIVPVMSLGPRAKILSDLNDESLVRSHKLTDFLQTCCDGAVYFRARTIGESRQDRVKERIKGRLPG